MALITNQQTQEQEAQAAKNQRLAQAFAQQGRTGASQRFAQMSQAQSSQASQTSQVLNRNIPQPSGPQQYTREKRDGKREYGTYEPVSVTQEGDQYLVEKRGLLSDNNSRGYRNDVYIKETYVVDANGDIISRDVYDTYETKSGREKAYLRIHETADQIREVVRDSTGAKVRQTVTDKSSGVERTSRFDPEADRQEDQQRQQALQNLGLTKDQISKLTPGQQKAVLDPRNAQKYTSTPVPTDVTQTVNRSQLPGGNITTVRNEVTGQTFQGSVIEGKFVGIRSVSEQEQAQREELQRLANLPVQRPGLGVTQQGQFPAGQTILVREGGKRGQTAAQIFKDLGAPQTKLIGDVTYSRQPKETVVQKGKDLFAGQKVFLPFGEFTLPGEKTVLPFSEASGRSQIFQTDYTVPNGASAEFAGFPTRDQQGNAIQFPAAFSVTTEQREFYPEKSFFEVNTPGLLSLYKSGQQELEAIDTKARSLADQARATPAGTTFTEGTASQRLERSLEDMGGRILMRVQDTGTFLKTAGGGLANAGERLEANNPYPSEQEVAANKVAPLSQQIPGGFSLIKRNLLFRAAKGAEGIGGFIEGEGQVLETKPATGGLGEALFVGGLFGGASETFSLIKGAGYAGDVAKAGTLARTARVVGTTGQVLEYGAGLGLGGVFVYQTVQEARAAPTTREAAQGLAQPLNELAAFGVGAKIGGKLVDVGATAGAKGVAEVRREIAIQKFNYKYQNQLITQPMARELATVSRDLSLNIDVEPIVANIRGRETMERAGLAVTESGEARVTGERTTITGEQLSNLGDEFLVRNVKAERQITLQENQGPTDATEAKGLPQAGSVQGQTQKISGSQRLASAEDVLGKERLTLKLSEIKKEGLPENFFTIQEAAKSDLGPGLRSLKQEIDIETFQPFEGSGVRDLAVVKGAAGPGEAGPIPLGFEPRKLTGPQNLGQIEKVVRFTEEPGPTQVLAETSKGLFVQRGRSQLALNTETGKFKLLEFTENRRFPRGTQEMPGRPILSEGTFTPEQQPLIFQKIKRAPKKAPGGETKVLAGGETEVSGGNGQVLIQKTETKQETKQKVKVKNTIKLEQEAKQTSKLESIAKLETKQETKQESFADQMRKSKTLTERLSKNKFSQVAEAATKQRNKLRAIPKLATRSITSQTFKTIQLQKQATDQAQKQENAQKQKQDQLQQPKLDLRTDQRTRQEQRQESLLDQLTNKARLTQELEVPEEIKPPKFGGLPFTKKGGGEQGYLALVKRFGKFEKISTQPLTKGQALAAGAQAADVTASQTFKIVPANETISNKKDLPEFGSGNILKKFKALGGETYREKKKSAIDTPGELQEITFKGLAASKSKRLRL